MREFPLFPWGYTFRIMARQVNVDAQIGRRLRLRDLHLFQTVVDRGSMAKAASALGMSQPAVSKIVADLEHALRVRLFDRGPHGVEPTAYGRALLKHSLSAFDELKQGVRSIEALSDPTRGELWVGCAAAPAADILPDIVHRFTEQYPRVLLHIDEVPPPRRDLSALRNRKCDLVIGRWMLPREETASDDLKIEFLFDDPLVVVANPRNPLAQRRKLDLADLIDQRWIFATPNTWNQSVFEEAFRARGLPLPRQSIVTVNVPVRTALLSRGDFVAAMPKSLADRLSLAILPVPLPKKSNPPVVIITLKDRTVAPSARLFIDCAHETVKARRA